MNVKELGKTLTLYTVVDENGTRLTKKVWMHAGHAKAHIRCQSKCYVNPRIMKYTYTLGGIQVHELSSVKVNI